MKLNIFEFVERRDQFQSRVCKEFRFVHDQEKGELEETAKEGMHKAHFGF